VANRRETVAGEVMESFRLCPTCSAPRCQVGSDSENPCGRPATARHDGTLFACAEHSNALHEGERADNAHEAVCYLKRWLWIARERANETLEILIDETLDEALDLEERAVERLAEARRAAASVPEQKRE